MLKKEFFIIYVHIRIYLVYKNKMKHNKKEIEIFSLSLSNCCDGSYLTHTHIYL